MVGLLLLIPALTVSVSLINWIITLVIPPRVLPKMDFEDNIPAEYKTLVVIPSLLSNAAEVKSLLKQVELHLLAQSGCASVLCAAHRFARHTATTRAPTLIRWSPRPSPASMRSTKNITAKRPGRFISSIAIPNGIRTKSAGWGGSANAANCIELNRLLRGGAKTAFSVQTGDLDDAA